MKFKELPQIWQDKLNEDRKDLYKKNQNGRWDVLLFNKEGTRYFNAHHYPGCGRYDFPYWHVQFGPLCFAKTKDKKGNETYEWRPNYNRHFSESLNGTWIPEKVSTKKDAIEIAKKIGIFGIE